MSKQSTERELGLFTDTEYTNIVILNSAARLFSQRSSWAYHNPLIFILEMFRPLEVFIQNLKGRIRKGAAGTGYLIMVPSILLHLALAPGLLFDMAESLVYGVLKLLVCWSPSALNAIERFQYGSFTIGNRVIRISSAIRATLLITLIIALTGGLGAIALPAALTSPYFLSVLGFKAVDATLETAPKKDNLNQGSSIIARIEKFLLRLIYRGYINEQWKDLEAHIASDLWNDSSGATRKVTALSMQAEGMTTSFEVRTNHGGKSRVEFAQGDELTKVKEFQETPRDNDDEDNDDNFPLPDITNAGSNPASTQELQPKKDVSNAARGPANPRDPTNPSATHGDHGPHH